MWLIIKEPVCRNRSTETVWLNEQFRLIIRTEEPIKVVRKVPAHTDLAFESCESCEWLQSIIRMAKQKNQSNGIYWKAPRQDTHAVVIFRNLLGFGQMKLCVCVCPFT